MVCCVCACVYLLYSCVFRCDFVCDAARFDFFSCVFVNVVLLMCVVSVRYSVMLYGMSLVVRFVVFVCDATCVVCF